MSVHEQVAGFALDALDPTEVHDFDRHLEVCPGCADALEPLQLAAAALAFVGELPLPRPELRLRVLDVGSSVVVPLHRRWPNLLLAASTAAAACAAIVVTLHVSTTTAAPSVAGLDAYVLQRPSSGLSLHSGGVLLVADTREAVLVTRGLPSPAPGTVYELWVVQRGRPVAAGFLRGRLGPLTRPVPRGAAVAVSAEPAGGSRRPTGPLLLRAETA